MAESSRSRWSWHFAAALVVVAALAQACGGSSSQSSGSQTGRAEFRFSQVKATRLGALPQGCTEVKVTFQPGNLVFSINDTQGSFIIPANQYVASATALCDGTSFPSDKPDPVVIVPAGLGEVSVSFVFGGVNVTLTVQVGPVVSVTGDGISCPGDCTQAFFAGTSVKLTANPSTAVFGGGCGGTGSCTVLLNQDKTVVVGLPNQIQPGSVTVNNAYVGEQQCCAADVTFTPGGIEPIDDLEDGDTITRTNVAPRSYTAHVSYPDFFEGGCEFQVPFTLDPGENEVLNISTDSCSLGLRRRR